MNETESQVKKSIKVLHYMVGFPSGTIVGPEHPDYATFETWANLRSIVTDDNGKGVKICEFADAEQPAAAPGDAKEVNAAGTADAAKAADKELK